MTTPPDSLTDRRLNRALAHVNNLWFPFNPAVVRSLEQGFQQNRFQQEPEKILEVLKQDFALFTYVIKELIPLASEARISASIICNPIELLRWAGPERIKQVVFSQNGLPSAHSLQTSEEFQADRLRETAIVASTAEVLSEKKNLDPAMGFCRGVLREIGLNLIAWNYPVLYQRIITSIPEGSSLDEELTKELGFSPLMLAMRIIHPKDLELEGPEMSCIKQEWQVYDDLCKVGEALAHADSPELYPAAENEWLVARETILQTVGPDAVEAIQQRTVANTQKYSKAMPAPFEQLQNFNPEKKVATHKRARRASHNRYIKYCTPEVQAVIRALYEEMPSEEVSRKVLERLVKEVIPKAGFTGGCVFVVDPSSLTLAPRTMIGKVKGRSIATITLRPNALAGLELGISESELIRAATVHDDGIANAFACAQPIIERDVSFLDSALTTIASSLGKRRRIGVLYLESPSLDNSQEDSTTVANFKAVRQLLCDALHLD